MWASFFFAVLVGPSLVVAGACGRPVDAQDTPKPMPAPSVGEDHDASELARLVEKLTPPPMLTWPVEHVHVTSFFEWRSDPLGAGTRMHRGIDLRGDVGNPVRSVAAGRVATSAYDPVLGHHVVVEHGEGLESLYAHLDARMVVGGVAVERGATIGRLGNTGRSEAPHLHLTLRVDGVAIDPLSVLGEPISVPRIMARPLAEPAP